jgi:hypothetical protein
VEQGEKLSSVILHWIEILSFDINLGRAAFGKILMLTWGEATLRWNFYYGGLHERYAVQREIWVPTQHFLYDRGKTRKTFIEKAGRRTFRMRTDFRYFAKWTSNKP